MTTPKLIEQDDSLPAAMTGEELVTMVSSLIGEHLSRVPLDDDNREALEDWEALGNGGRRRSTLAEAGTAAPVEGKRVFWLVSDLIAAHIDAVPRDDGMRGPLKILASLDGPRWRR